MMLRRTNPSTHRLLRFPLFTGRHFSTAKPTVIKTGNGSWEVVVGIECHAQIASQQKLFSTSPLRFAETPNSHVSAFDAAFPGCLPVINKKCVELAVKTGLALKGRIHLRSFFDRKHYFYSDLPAGFQITQQFLPLVVEGKLKLELPTHSKEVSIHHIRLEQVCLFIVVLTWIEVSSQDSGKSLHESHPLYSYVDLNRAGAALMEIVSNPDMRSSEEAGCYVRTLQSLLRHLGTCDGNMDEGSLRCDVNVSVMKEGSKQFGTRCEIKNLNSIRYLEKAIDYEAKRQIQLLERGEKVSQETRGYNASNSTTFRLRSKEEDVDYRYFPEPDLPPLVIESGWVESIQKALGELPNAMFERFCQEYQLSRNDAAILIDTPGASEYFEKVLELSGSSPKKVFNWISVEVFRYCNEQKLSLDSPPVSTEQVASILKLIDSNVISGKIGKSVICMMFQGDKRMANEIIKEQKMEMLTDDSELESICLKVVQAHPNEVAQVKAGKERKMAHLVGQVMKQTHGKAKPDLVNKIIMKCIQNTSSPSSK